MSGKKPSRETTARQEIGSTIVSPPLARLLAVFFLMSIFIVPLGQYGYDRQQSTSTLSSAESAQTGGSGESLFAMIDRRNTAILEEINGVETNLEEGSLLRKMFLPPLQYVFLRFFHKGNEKAIPGRDDSLHFAPALDSLIGPPFLQADQLRVRVAAHKLWEKPVQPEPLSAIIDFQQQLAARGIILVVLPVPVKASIQPEKLSARSVGRPLANRSWPAFVDGLREKGVRLFDPRPILSRYAAEHGDAYLSTDTHWSPGAMQAVAQELAEVIGKDMGPRASEFILQAQEQKVVGYGDIARMLTLPPSSDLYPGQEVLVRQITTAGQEFWQPDKNAEILLLGDSFTNIYSVEGLGWGVGGGFAEQLSYILQTPLDLLARNDSGAYVTREMLAAELARGRDRLAGKKVVIWQFAERELALGDWRKIELKLGARKDTGFFVAPAGEKTRVTGVISALSRSARPGSVPYRDNILTLHLIDLEGIDRQLPAGQALVYGWGMRDNQLTALAALRPGDRVALTIAPWEEVEGEFGGYRRSSLDDEEIELETANWGSLHAEKNP